MKKAIQKYKIGKQSNIDAPGVSNLKGSVELAKKSDYITLCLREHNYTEASGDIGYRLNTKLRIRLTKISVKLDKITLLIFSKLRSIIGGGFEEKRAQWLIDVPLEIN
ncbi:hypothetical protein [Aquimarina sediminis]|uniref:hypothetical protein n=1 Tax=Aquimarina sediminis TaxID=2070536 RepID=UPI000CA07269|nr:hypothetical protein [Aquimarina sediminis]